MKLKSLRGYISANAVSGKIILKVFNEIPIKTWNLIWVEIDDPIDNTIVRNVVAHIRNEILETKIS